MHIHLVKRHIAGELQPRHDHPRDPEEDDVKAGHQHAGRVKRLHLRRLRRPAQRRERPQRRRKPGVQHIRFLRQRHLAAQVVLVAHRLFGIADIQVAAVVIPRRYPVPPPQLPADAPVLDVVHPLKIGLLPAFRHKAHAPVAHRLARRRRQLPRVDKPLVGQVRLDHRVAAVAARHRVAVRALVFQQALFAQIRQHALARLKALQPAVRLRRARAERRVVVEQVDHRQIVAPPDFIVVEVVRRRNLDAAGAEFHLHIVVGKQRDDAPGQRQRQAPADGVPVALVVRMNGGGGVAEQGFRARRRDDDMAVAVGVRVANVPQAPVFLVGNHFQVRHRGFQHRIPVDQPLAAVNQPLVVQADKRLAHRARHVVVHREAFAAPVERRAEAAQLLRDHAARLFLPLPHLFNKGVAPEREARLAAGLQLPLDDHLRRDAGVVSADLPQRLVARHAPVAYQAVHQRNLEGVPHVQRAGHIRRRNHDAAGRAVAARREQAERFPAPVPALLDLLRAVGLVHGFGAPVGGRRRGRTVAAHRGFQGNCRGGFQAPARFSRNSVSSGTGRPVAPLFLPVYQATPAMSRCAHR